jgi:hypothetical protein
VVAPLRDFGRLAGLDVNDEGGEEFVAVGPLAIIAPGAFKAVAVGRGSHGKGGDFHGVATVRRGG